MNWRRPAAALPVVLGALSLWLPWVGHRGAALVLTGLDLPDFVRFMGASAAPLVRPTQIAFAVPLLALATTGILWAWSRASATFWFRAAALVMALWLASVAFSPLERRREFLLVGSALILAWLVAGAMRAPMWSARAVGLVGGLAGAVATLVQFARVMPALAGLYGTVVWGVGPWLALAAAATATVAVADACWRRVVRPALSRRRSTRV